MLVALNNSKNTMTDYNLQIPELLNQLEAKITEQLSLRNIHNPVMIAIHNGGVWIAQQLHQRLKIKETLGVMDISFYRDDFSQIGMHPQVQPSHIPVSLEGRDIILVDDVFYTARTARAALNEIFDFGRPHQVLLAVLIERDGRQIPLKPDCIGTYLPLPEGVRIKLTGPEPLGVHIQSFDTVV
jgi:pyrimidine operon attenuation protein/uracil phosphoribosyltransferase